MTDQTLHPRRLGVNIDHVATLRQARGTPYPSPARAARVCTDAGADLITLHLREDARHIQLSDLKTLIEEGFCQVNLELAPTERMVEIACRHRPDDCCLVPEKRMELTTEGGLDVRRWAKKIEPLVRELRRENIRVSVFIEPDAEQLRAARECGVEVVELHTGAYANARESGAELSRLVKASAYGEELGLRVNAGHGLTLDNLAPVARIATLAEFNIGHFVISYAVFVGLTRAVREVKSAIARV